MEEVQKEIAQQKADIDNFLAKEGLLTFRGIDGFETEQLSIVTNRLADATQRRIAAESLEKAVSAGGRVSLDNIISLPTISNHAQIQDLRIAMIQAQRSLYELQKSYGPKHAKILEAQAQVKAIQDQMGVVLSELKKAFISNIWPRWRMKRIIRRNLINRKKFFRNWLKNAACITARNCHWINWKIFIKPCISGPRNCLCPALMRMQCCTIRLSRQ